jgi:phosphoribosylformylglycinamidine cyclo-ligase
MGHRMELYTDPETAESIIEASMAMGVDAKVIGHCEAFEGKRVTVSGAHGSFQYGD